MPTMGLYYPSLEFRDDGWVKFAALYWDSLGRIVPRTYRPKDSETVQRLNDNDEFIRNYEPSDVADEVGWVLAGLIEFHPAEFRKRFRVDNLLNDDLATTGDCVSFLLGRKVSVYLRIVLERTGLLVQGGDESSHGQDLIGLHPILARVYMTELAERLASRHGLQPIADGALAHLSLAGWTLERLAQTLIEGIDLTEERATQQEIQAQLALVAVQAAIPVNIDHVPIDKVIEFRRRHASERSAFLELLDTLAERIAQRDIRDTDVLNDFVHDEYTHRLRPQVEDLKKAMRSCNIDSTVGLVNMAVAAGSGAALNLPPVVTSGAALAVGAVTVLRDRYKAQQDARSAAQAASYLLNMQEVLGAGTLVTRLAREAQRFVL